MIICFSSFDGKTTDSITFPISFTHIPTVVTCLMGNVSTSALVYQYGKDVTSTGFTRQKNASTITVHYIAIGY